MSEIKMKDYKTMTYRGMDFGISPELIQDLHANMVDVEEFENHIHELYLQRLPEIRNNKIDQILSDSKPS